MASITLQDGRTYRGWAAVPWIVLFSPLIVVALGYGVALYLARFISGRDEIWGWRYDRKTKIWTRNA